MHKVQIRNFIKVKQFNHGVTLSKNGVTLFFLIFAE
jgi:hypothetical protein